MDGDTLRENSELDVAATESVPHGVDANNLYHLTILREELARRCQQNPRYSMRAFARSLGVDIGVLSRTMSGKRGMSLKVARRMGENLGLAPKQLERFLASLHDGQRKRELPDLAEPSLPVPREIEADMFRIISDWYHYAILELTFVEGFKSEPKWIAKALGISALEARLAIDRLLYIGLLAKADGHLTKSSGMVTTGPRLFTTPALRNHQRQMLQKACQSLEDDPIEERDMTGMTMAIDPKRLPTAIRMIAEFRRALCDYLEGGEQTRVYQLAVNLFPLQRKEISR